MGECCCRVTLFSSGEKIFKDAMTTAAVIDRLVHHCVILELNLPSYRMEAAPKEESGESRRQFGGMNSISIY